MSEAKAAAAFAIREYNVNKKASLTTFVYECVKNRLIDVTKAKEPDFIYELPEETYTTEDDLNFSLTMRGLLSPEEYAIFYMRFVEDYSEREIALKLKTHRKRVKECLHRILQRYLSIEKNHHRISTQRRLAAKWLDDSPSLQNE